MGEKNKSTRLNKYICSLTLIIPPLPVDDDAVPLTKQEMLSPTDGGSDSHGRQAHIKDGMSMVTDVSKHSYITK